MKTNTTYQWILLAVAGIFLISPPPTRAVEPSAVTFAGDIAKIVHRKCTMCHRAGQSAPFELVSYEDVRDRGATIEAVIHDDYMPPWKPVNDNVQFANDRRLTVKERRLISQWVNSGMAAGDLDTVTVPSFPDGWSLGKPDLVVQMNGEFKVPATGPDIYRSFVFPVSLPDDKWIKAIELKPSARGVVHHALFFVDTSGEARKNDGKDGRPGFSGMSFLSNNQRSRSRTSSPRRPTSLGGYVPGATPNRLPGDLALHLPKGSDIVMQTHFHPSGKSELESSQIAFYFTDKPPSQKLVPIQVPPLFGRFAGIDVRPGKSQEIRKSFTLPVDIQGIQISGHAHYLCREMDLQATLPDGNQLDLLCIDDWDLDWQDQYQFKQPVSLPEGTRLDVRLLYDNSEDNPENPYSPPKRIAWGRESTDEMGSITLHAIAKNESDRPALERGIRTHLIKSIREAGSSKISSATDTPKPPARGAGDLRLLLQRPGLFSRLDVNKNEQLEWSEVPENFRKRVFDYADLNHDKVIDQSEAKQLRDRLGGR